MKRLALSLVALLLVLIALPLAAQEQDADLSGTPQAICEAATPAADPETRDYAEPGDVLEEGVDYRAIFCTESGPVYVDLLEDMSPLAVNSFVFLAQNDYYNNTTFHRVLPGFMAQGGDPTATGTGGPGYNFADEQGFLTFNTPGLLAMANAGPNTNGSQFFITTVPTPHLNGRHTIFGDVLTGQANVENLRERDPQQNPDFEGASLDTVVIIDDPALVETDYAADPLDQMAIQALLDTTVEQLAPQITRGEGAASLTAEAVVASAPDDLQEAVSAWAEAYGYEFGIREELVNAECSDELFFSTLTFTLHDFGSAADASAAIAEGTLNELILAQGFEASEAETSDAMVYTRSEGVTTCNDNEGVAARMIFQRGRYVTVAGLVMEAALLEQAPADVIITQGVSAVFDQILTGAYLEGLR